MRNAMLQDIFREIWRTKSRFFAIAIIVALGVGFLYGIKVTSPSMRYTADRYFDAQKFADLHLISTAGFTRSDVDALRLQEGIRTVAPAFSINAMIESRSGLKTVRFHSIPPADGGMDLPVLSGGRWPENDHECLLDRKQAGNLGQIGSVITISDKNKPEALGLLQNKQYTITGFADSPEYINYTKRGSLSISDGSVYSFIYIPEGNFKSDFYTDLLVGIDGVEALQGYTDEYDDMAAAAAEKLEEFAVSRESVRYAEILAQTNEAIAKAQSEITKAEAELIKARAAQSDAEKDFAMRSSSARSEIESASAELASKWAEYEKGKSALEAGRASLADLEQQIRLLRQAGMHQQAAALELRRIEALSQLNVGRNELSSSLLMLETAQTQLDARKDEFETVQASAMTGFGSAKAELMRSEAALSEARAELAAKQSQALLIAKPQWYILTRSDSMDYSSFGADARRVDALSTVFPIFFYIIAALVCLTTLTRMVEEHRTQMGVMRALGYTHSSVALKYLLYACLASIFGCVAGLLAGHFLLPLLIYRTYQSTYTLPPLTVPFDIPVAFTASLIAISINVLAALWACNHEVHSVPAELIRPKAPLPGNRVLLERIPFIWNRLSFMSKVTARNLFRFKKRFFMTVFGIAGCTALLLTGFGLRDSIAGTVPKQYYGLHSYHLFMNLISPGDNTRPEGLNASLSGMLDDWLYAAQIKVDVDGLDKMMTTYVFVPEDADKASGFVNFHTRKTGRPIAFPQPGKVILTEKIASVLGVKTGDTVTFNQKDQAPVTATVGGVTENYVYNYIFMTPQDYRSAFGAPPEYKMILGKVADGETIGQDREKTLTAELLKLDNVLAATTIASLRREFDESMRNLDAVIMVIILCACLLNFVVLYNLININITERTREIATIKVLGFVNREVTAYINREIISLTLIGIAAGIAGGIFLHAFTIKNAEADILMYVREIDPMSYWWSILLTLLFTVLINFAIQLRLRRIKMVESLKSVE